MAKTQKHPKKQGRHAQPPVNDDSVIVRKALDSTDSGYLAKILARRQPSELGTTFKGAVTREHLKQAKWAAAQRPFEGLPANVKVFVTTDIGGLADKLPLSDFHPCLVMLLGTHGPIVEGNFRKPTPETYILIEWDEENSDAVVVDVIPGGPVFPRVPSKFPPRLDSNDVRHGQKFVRKDMEALGYSHALVVPRSKTEYACAA
jgi:hypothetical protein